MMRLLAIVLLLLAAPAVADSNLPPAEWANRQLPDPQQEAKAKALMEEIRCLVCQGQSIADSDADMAGDMRSMIRQRVAAGEEPSAIKQWLVDRYGDWVTYDPPVSGTTWPLWGLPIILLLVGGAIAARRLRRRR